MEITSIVQKRRKYVQIKKKKKKRKRRKNSGQMLRSQSQ